jgi:hypothetical protein
MRGEPGFFDLDDRLKRLSDLGDQLEAFRVPKRLLRLGLAAHGGKLHDVAAHCRQLFPRSNASEKARSPGGPFSIARRTRLPSS